MTAGRSGATSRSTVNCAARISAARPGEHRVDDLGRAQRLEHVGLPSVARRGEPENALDEPRQLADFVADHRPVLLQLLRRVDHAARDVVGRRSDDRQRRAELVRHRGHEVHLQPCDALRANGGHDEHRQAQHQQEQGGEADGEPPLPHLRDEQSRAARRAGGAR